MEEQEINRLLSKWSSEINESLKKSKSLCIALFRTNGELLFSTPVMRNFFKGEPSKSLINPTFDQLIGNKSNSSLIFDGIITIGDYNSINNSIEAQVYLKDDELLIIGGENTTQLIEYAQSIFNVNRQINNLQRELLLEKLRLEDTLKQLNEANLELEQLNATKDKFFSIIAHDLRGPFNAILGYSQILLQCVKANKLDNIEQYADYILQSSKRSMELLMNLMEWAQSQTGRISFVPEYLEMETFVNEATILYDDVARQKSIKIERRLPKNVYFFADKAMINTVFRNLISNAIKFTEPGGKITVSADVRQNEILFIVKDSGVGIPKNSIEKLFKIEQSYTTLGTNNENGTGLGLILCKEFVEKHGGKIWVESTEGKGSTFYFSLPCNAEQIKEKP